MGHLQEHRSQKLGRGQLGDDGYIRLRYTQVLRYLGIHKYAGAQVHKGTQVHECTGMHCHHSQVYRYTDTQIHATQVLS